MSHRSRLLAGLAAVLLAGGCSGAGDRAIPDDNQPAPATGGGDESTAGAGETAGVAPDASVTFEADRAEAPWDLVGIGDSFLGWSTVTEQYAELVSGDLGIEIRVARIVSPTSNRLEYLRTSEAAQELLAETEIVVVQPQPGPATDPEMTLYLDGECGGPDNQECFRIAQADYGLYVGELLDELVAATPDDTTIVVALVGTWGSAGFNPGIEEADPEAHRSFVDHILALQNEGAGAAAERGIATVDVSLALTGPDYYQPVSETYLRPDRLHLTDEGSRVVAESLYRLSSPVPP